MDVDPEIAPLISQTRARLDKIEQELLPMLRALDEDAVVSHYSIDEQARLYLAAAFTMAFSLYAVDKLNHRQHRGVKVSGDSSHRALHEASALTSDGQQNADPQLLLKIERIADYIKKLSKIAELAKLQQQHEKASEEDKAAPAEVEGVTASDSASRRKRARETDAETASKPHGDPGRDSTGAAAQEDDMGDAAMFSTVSRVPGETGIIVGRLLRHVQGGNISSK